MPDNPVKNRKGSVTIMSEINKNEELLSADRPVRPKVNWTNPERVFNVLLGVSVAQIVLGLLLYMIISINFLVYFTVGILAIGMAFITHFKVDNRVVRVLIRILLIVGMAGSALTGIGFLMYANSVDAEYIQLYIAYTIAFLLLPIMLFLQPVFIIKAEKRHRVDIVLMRIAAIFTLLLSLLLCFYALEYSYGGQQCIVTSNTYEFTIFSQDISFTLGIDCIFSRLIFCACSGVITVFSFLLHAERSLDADKSQGSIGRGPIGHGPRERKDKESRKRSL